MYQTHQLYECYETGCLDMDEIPGMQLSHDNKNQGTSF